MTDEIQEVESEEVEQSESQEVEQAQADPETEKAISNGWRPKDEWQGDPDDWVSARKFNQTGELMGSIRDLKSRLDKSERSFQSRLDNVNKLHETQQAQLLADLERKRNDAVEMADVDAVNNIQGQIDNLRQAPQVQETQQDDSALLDDWNAKNPYIFDQSNPKAAFAQARFNVHSQNMPLSDAIKAMEQDINSAFPEINERRNQAPAVESGMSRPGQRKERKLTWGDLTPEEVKYYNVARGAWTKDEYLQAVQDSRKA
jgi:hypothetical protein